MKPKYSHLLFLLATVSCCSTASAASGTWSSTNDGEWSVSGNWSGGIIAEDSGLATFSVDVPVTDLTVNMDGAHKLGGLTFGDANATTAGNWLLTNNGHEDNTLILGTTTDLGTINVNNLGTGKNATISANIVNDLLKGESNGLIKAGDGLLVLSGNNYYTGATIVSGGTLVLNGANGTSSGITVKEGATLGGSGEVFNITLEKGAILAPGNNGIGLLTVDDSLTFNNEPKKGSILSLKLLQQITPAGRGTDFDAVDVGGAIYDGSISGSDGIIRMIVGGLDLDPNGDLNPGSAFWSTDKSWQIFNQGFLSGNGFISFELYSSASLSTQVSYSQAGSFSFNKSTGALAWTAAVPVVPEPGGPLAALLMVAGLMRRRKTV